MKSDNQPKPQFFYVKSICISNQSVQPEKIDILNRKFPKPLNPIKRKSFLILDLKKEGKLKFFMKYLFVKVYIYSLLGIVFTIFLAKVFEYLPFICFDRNFENELYDKGLCFCKDFWARVITYLRRGALIVNLIGVCNLEIVNSFIKLTIYVYYLWFAILHAFALIVHLIVPNEWEYFIVNTLIDLMIFLSFFLVSKGFLLRRRDKKAYNIQFFGLFVMFCFHYVIYCFLNANYFEAIRDVFFGNNAKIFIFIVLFHIIMTYISSSRDVLVEKVKPNNFIKKVIIMTSNCVFSCTKMGFFMALRVNEFNFYFNAVCLLYSNVSHTLSFFKKKIFFKLRLNRLRFLKKLGIWKICLKSSLDKKIINGSFIFERFLNYYIIAYIFFADKYFVDPLDTQNYAKNCTLELKHDFLLDYREIICYFAVDFLSVVIILLLNNYQNLDEIKYKTPEDISFFKEISILLGVYYYSHYLFVLGYYIKYFIKNAKG